MASNVNPSKRPFQKNSSEHNGRGKWQKTKHTSSQQPPLVIQPGVPLIRILCPTEKCGNVIGKGGVIIAKIRQENGVKIRVDEAVPGCDERVIVITITEKDKEASREQGKQNVGGAAVSADAEHEKEKDHIKEENVDSENNHGKEEKVDSENNHGKEEKVDSERDASKEEKDDPSVAKDTKAEPERVLLSPMNAILHVFDRIFITEIGNESGDPSGERTPVSFRLLVLDSQVGWLLGNRGSVIKQMSADSGCEIRVSKEKLPLCALLKDELCQITGELDSVRKGLNAVAQVLLTHPPRESDVLPSGLSSHAFNRSDALPPGMQPNFSLPFQGPSHARGPFDSIDPRPNIPPFPTFPDQRSNIPPFPAFPDALMHSHASVPPEPLTFRLLCSSDKVGSIIGKGGNNIKTIQKDTGCEIKILETVPKSEDRVIVISGPAHPGDGISPAQNAILHVQRRITPPTANNKEGAAISRLIVSPNQVGCLLGKGGSIIAEMRKLSKAHIVVLSKDKIPKGVQESDEVVQITGDSEAIQEALMQITARLRNHLFRDRMAAMGPNMQPPFGSLDPQFGAFAGSHESTSPRIYPNASQFHKDFMGRPLDEMPAPWNAKGMRDVGDPMSISGMPGMPHRGIGGFSGAGHSSMPNITRDIMVPRFVIPALCGHDGGCLNMIREFSGAMITFTEPIADAADTPFMISGTLDQMHAARSLIQAFVLSEPPAP
ncbi:KH domain-containing protein HEN4 isoform X2 [Brachypodium distachyon]|uniref:KH domain-containing protein HEN4 isoform X2 n=1 Tax=Brachypodium distachyon TaxID=15368 RepID=UPI00052FFACF|nr:KH domain-containing protein HEN4 isoform X2 [Brachypodium distachyon]|eukprot:XP_010230666.1 KH domain-containing protein HEN4 isoform X2 [Brachypodium distachyon]